jgi:hypothetical protein
MQMAIFSSPTEKLPGTAALKSSSSTTTTSALKSSSSANGFHVDPQQKH